MVNGRPRDKFRATRGFRQGDPLSPFLFILVTDVLSRLMERAQQNNLIHGLFIGTDRVEVSHLQFADDTIFFLGDKEEYWHNLLEILDLFCIVTGLKINKAKCALVGLGCNSVYLNRLAEGWGCRVEEWPMKYLGLPLGGNPRAKFFWDPVVEKVQRRLQKWRKADLSRGGRLTLIQAVLSSIPSYYMSLFKMPVSVVSRVEGDMRSFLWEGVEEGRKDHLVRWEVAAKSKMEGGLGVGCLREKNQALCAKWLWRLPLEPTSLWVRVIKSKYGCASNGWDANPAPSTLSSNPWKDISAGYQNYLLCCSFEVGNGNKVRFWEDRWLREGILKDIFPRLFALSSKQTCSLSAFVDSQVEPHNWDFGFRRNLNDRETTEAISLLQMLEGVRVRETRLDRRIWDVEQSGTYSCKSFKSFLSNKENDANFQPYDLVWRVMSPPKVKVFVWLMALGKLNTSDMVQRRRPYMHLLA